MPSIAPLALFVYNRPDHTRRTVEALLKNRVAGKSDLFIFSDGPRHSSAVDSVKEVRSFCRSIKGFKNLHIEERQENWGLSKSIITGVTSIVDSKGEAIVLEDDLVTSPYFLEFMQKGLDTYREEERVASIHGYCYPIKGLPETFFLRGADCWGWATWSRAWKEFEPNGSLLLQDLKNRKLLSAFSQNGSNDNVRMLKDQIAQKNDSWAIRWHASMFLQNKLTLYPGQSLVQNIGCDDSGTHSGASTRFLVELNEQKVPAMPSNVKENAEANLQFATFLGSQAHPLRRLMRRTSHALNL